MNEPSVAESIEAGSLKAGDIVLVGGLSKTVDHVARIEGSVSVRVYFADGSDCLSPRSIRFTVIGRDDQYSQLPTRMYRVSTDDDEDLHAFLSLKAAVEFMRLKLEQGTGVCASADMIPAESRLDSK